jgi:hypothetical protein
MAEVLGISASAFQMGKAKYVEFSAAIKPGKEVADEAV